MQETQENQFRSLGQEDQVEKEWQPTPIFMPGKFHGQRSLADYSPWGCKVRHNWATKHTHIHAHTHTHTHTHMVTDILSSWQTSPDSLVGRESNTTKKRKLLLSLTKIHFIRETTVSCTGIYKLGGRNSFLLMWQREKAMTPPLQYCCLKIPWMKEPGRLRSMGSLRVGHDWVTSLSLFTFMHWRRKWQPTPVFLPGESHGWRSLVGCSPWGHTESDMTEAT